MGIVVRATEGGTMRTRGSGLVYQAGKPVARVKYDLKRSPSLGGSERHVADSQTGREGSGKRVTGILTSADRRLSGLDALAENLALELEDGTRLSFLIKRKSFRNKMSELTVVLGSVEQP